MKKLVIFLLMVYSNIYLLSGQNILWSKCYGGRGHDFATSIKQTKDGGFIVAGYTESNDQDVWGQHDKNGTYYDFWIVQLDASGDTVWTRCYGGSDNDYAYDIQQTKDGGFVVAGYALSTDGDVWGNHGKEDCWVLRLDANGDTLWTRCFGNSRDDEAFAIQQTTDGGFIVAGTSYSHDNAHDYLVMRLNANGDILWTRYYGGTSTDWATSIQQTTDGGFIVAGWSESTDGDVWGNHGTEDFWVVRLNASGDTLWTRCFGGSDIDEANSILQTQDGGFIVAGGTLSTDNEVWGNHGFGDFWTLRLDANGDTLWTRCFGGSLAEWAFEINQTTDGGFIMAGKGESTDGDMWGLHGYDDAWVIQLDANGDTLWTRSYGGSNDDEAFAVIQTSNGDYIVAGNTFSVDGDTPGKTGGQNDYWIVRLGIMTGIPKQQLPQAIDIFPNPANHQLYIDCSKPFTIEISDLSGKLLMISNHKNTNISKLRPGIYLVAVKNKDGELLKTSKLVVK